MGKRSSVMVLSLSLLAFLLAGCGGSSSGGTSNELDLGPTTFVQSSITLSAGQALHVVDPQSGGGTHILCLGQDGACTPNATGPSELHSPGMMFSSGTTKDITFSTAGTYHITCTIHRSMNLTVSVQ
jgi:plastocyanin